MGRKRKEVDVNPVQLRLTEICWAAGFFDGEGNICFTMVPIRRKDERRDRYPRIVAQISQVDPEVLFRFQAAVGGMGRVGGPYPYKGKVNGQPWYRYVISTPNEVHFLVELLRPYLSSLKIKQAENALRRYSENEVIYG